MRWIRQGKCVRCGMCCTGFADPCPHIHWIDSETCECLVYERRDDPSLKGTTPANLPGCIEFPDGPEALLHPQIKNKCGYYFIPVEKILVGCTTYEGKEYCFQEYLDAIDAITWPEKEILIVDTSDTEEFYERWLPKVHGRFGRVPQAVGQGPNMKIAWGMEAIRQYLLISDCDRWLNLEADVICPPNIIEELMKWRDLDWIAHAYPMRGENLPPHMMTAFGCVIFNRRVLEMENFIDCPEDQTTDGWFWRKVENRVSACDLWGLFDLKHRGITRG